jgi:uncharacterized protein with GYD domain
MATYVLMTKLAPTALQDRRLTGHDWKKKVGQLCPEVRWLNHYALLGPYDFMDIYTAPDDETAFRVSALSRELGALTAESWPALEYERYLGLVDGVEVAAKGAKK